MALGHAFPPSSQTDGDLKSKQQLSYYNNTFNIIMVALPGSTTVADVLVAFKVVPVSLPLGPATVVATVSP